MTAATTAFGCQADGDAISFVSRYFELTPTDAAKKLANDFGIPYDEQPYSQPEPKPEDPAEIQFKDTTAYCYGVLCDYLCLLDIWRTSLAPATPEETWHPLFTEAIQRRDYVDYLANDVLMNGTVEDKAEFIKTYGKDVVQLEGRIKKFATVTAGSCDKGNAGNEGAAGFAANGLRPEH